MVEIMKIWQLINFDCIYCQNFSTKTKFILGFLFIIITLVGLHNIHVLNYTRNIFFKNCIPNTRKHSQTHFQGYYQTLENETVFLKMLFEKWIIFQKTLMLKQTKHTCLSWNTQKNTSLHVWKERHINNMKHKYKNKNKF